MCLHRPHGRFCIGDRATPLLPSYFAPILKLKAKTNHPIHLNALVVIVIALLGLPCLAAEENKELAAMQSAAQKAFKLNVEKFAAKYCFECHGNRRSKAGLNLEIAIRKPGEPGLSRKWMECMDGTAPDQKKSR